MTRIVAHLVFAVILVASGAAAQAPERLVFATDWLAQAEHGGFYQARRRGHLPEARPRRDDQDGRAAGQRPAAARRGPARRGDGRRAAGRLGDRAEGAGHRDRRDVPEESDGDHRPSRRGEARGPQGQADRHRRRQQHDVLALAQAALRLHRRPEAAVRLQRAAVPRRPERCRSRASRPPSRSRSKRAASSRWCSCWPTSAIRRTPRCSSSPATRSPSAPTRSRASSARRPKAGRAISPIRRRATRSSSATIRRWATNCSPTATAR